jgi:hypothetical protein
MRTSNLQATVAIGGAFLFISLLSFGCGNPEAPQITEVRLSYRDSIIPVPEDPEWHPDWVSLENGKEAPQSPVRIRGNMTDNTAVVNPKITWIGKRGDVDELGFTECSEGTKDFYECEMECEGPTPDGYFECTPALDAPKLIRGDEFLMTGTTAGGEEFELKVSVSEAQGLKDNEEGIEVDTEYRILRVSSLKGDPSLIWSVYQKTTDCRIGTLLEGCGVDEVSGAWRALRSGDSLCWHQAVDEERDCSFQISLKQADGENAIDSVSATWSSLVKWNDKFFLNWDATTGDFVEEFQVFDPRDRQDMIDGVGAPTYRYVVSAEDVPDQKTKVFRYSQVARELLFSPEMATQEPDLEVDGEDKELVKTSKSAQDIKGKVKSFSGEVRSLTFTLSNGPEGSRNRSLYFNPSNISIEGAFKATMVYVSDWDGDGVVDEWNKEEGIPNTLDVVALDVQGNFTDTTVPIVFLPSTKKGQAPELQVQEIFPALDKHQKGALPFGEEIRVRAMARDERGQPAFSAYECACVAEEPLINNERCPCEALTGRTETPEREDDWVDLNAGGRFPRDPWGWIVVEPVSEPQETFGVLLAKEKVDDPEDRPTAKISGIQIDLDPEMEEEIYNISVSQRLTSGPNVLLSGLKNGDIVDPHGLIVQATIYANVSAVNQITALWNGQPRGAPTYDSKTAAFLWDLQAFTVREGDRICLGATSVTGHETLYLLEFADTTDGLLLGVTKTSDRAECIQAP